MISWKLLLILPTADGRNQPTLNNLAALPKAQHQELRTRLRSILHDDAVIDSWKENVSAVQMHLPIDARGFTDFSCSKEHCLNAGEAIMKKRLLPPGFLHFPIGYSGRASSLVVCISCTSPAFQNGNCLKCGTVHALSKNRADQIIT